ncbi:hypothetical protein ACU063_14895 [Paenibacillus sp. M.A.Huq-81]
MIKVSHLEIKPGTRFHETDPDQDGNKNTRFADLLIDGKSLYQMLRKHDLVPALGWGSKEHQRKTIDYFLLRQRHEYLYYR